MVARITMDAVVRWLVLLLLIITAVVLARLTWVVIEPSSVLSPTGSTSSAVIAPAGEETSLRGGFREMAALQIFGRVAAPKTLDAPDTSLSWSLKGVFADPDPSRSAAILAPQGQTEKLYRAGAELPGQVTLQEVLADRVILNRGGRLETLRLKSNTINSAASYRRAPALPVSTGNPSGGDAPRVDRDAWINDPQRFLDVITANPVMQDGVLYGLQISPARNAREFAAAGLKAGDVITGVDGSPVAEITDYRDLLKSLADATSVAVALERDGEPMNITINMD